MNNRTLREVFAKALAFGAACSVSATAAAQAASSSASAPPSIVPVVMVRVKTEPSQIELTPPTGEFDAESTMVVLGSFEQEQFISLPLARFHAETQSFNIGLEEARGLFDPGESGPGRRLRAWLVRDEVCAEVRRRWPAEAPFFAVVESLGPGSQTAWLDVGARQGVSTGDTFLAHVGVQPVLRLDVRSVLDDLAFCRVTPLASGARLEIGGRVQAWPSPGELREGRCRSTVCFAEPAGEAQMLWIARPPRGFEVSEPRMELFRDGRYVGFASVERRDALFWYARTLTPATVEPVRVGDVAQVRTRADIAAGRVSARVFAINEQGALITAGENDGISAGQLASALRGDRSLGLVEALRVTGGYATIRMQTAASQASSGESGSGSEAPLQQFDEIRFASPRLPGPVVGSVAAVDGDAMAINLESASLPRPGTVLAVRDKDETRGVAVILDVEGTRAAAYLLPASRVRPIRAGAVVVSSE